MIRRESVRAVLFDAVGTLIHPQPDVAEAYRRAGLKYGIDLPAEEIRRRFHTAFQTDNTALNVAGAESALRSDPQREVTRWRQIVSAVFPTATDPAALFHTLWQHFAEPRHWRLDPTVPAVIQRLEAAGLRLGVASNFDSRLRDIAPSSLPAALAQRLFISAEIGWRKPAPEFYRHVERALNLRPEQILLVGDDLENDFSGAHAAGWQALLLSASVSTTVAISDQLSSLSELPALVGPHATPSSQR